VPAETGGMLRRALQDKGVDWCFRATVDSLDRSGDRLRATLSDGDAFETDLVLSAAGLVPNTQLAEKAGLQTAGGIVTDALMRTSQPDVYALGDCASVDGRVFAYIEPIRRQAETIAAGFRGETLPFSGKPPLVRVKTPSFPLVICPPRDPGLGQARCSQGEARVDWLVDDEPVGFVLSGSQATDGMSLYRQLYG
jgi:rubredoxin---NAD+ reductase